MKKKIMILMILLLSLAISNISVVMAADMNGTYVGHPNTTYDVMTSENITLHGYFLNSSKSSPSSNYTLYDININTSSIQNSIKELIVKYYNTPLSSYLQTAIWHVTNNNSVAGISEEMINNLTGVEIGNSYSYTDGNFTYNFTFYIGFPNTQNTQSLVLFDLDVSELNTNGTTPGNNTNGTNPGNNTNGTNPGNNQNNIQNNTNNNGANNTNNNGNNQGNNQNNVDSGTGSGTTTEKDSSVTNSSNNTYEKNNPVVSSDNNENTYYVPSAGSPNEDSDNSNAKSAQKEDINTNNQKTVSMKETGMPIIPILLSIFMTIGIIVNRKK